MKTTCARLRSLARNASQDIRFAVRQIRREPGSTLFTVQVLALGIGTVTAMFTVAYAVLLKPLPFAMDRSLYQPVVHTPTGIDTPSISWDEIQEWRRATQGTAEVAFNGGGLNIADGPAGAVLITEIQTSPNLFSLLGAKPILGRVFSPQENQAEDADVVLLSYALWQQEFGGDRNVLGKSLHIGPVSHTVIGVMPPQFMYPMGEKGPQAWVPVAPEEMRAGNRDSYLYFTPLLRLRSTVPALAVETQLTRAHAQFAGPAQSDIHLARLHDLLVADARPALLTLELAVGVVWLIACSNVAGLLLARVVARRTEIAVRAALGAGKRRILLQFLTESLVLSCAGALCGLGLAKALLQAFRELLSAKLPLASDIHLNWAVWLALFALTLLTALAFAAPAFLAARTKMNAALRSGGRTMSQDRAHHRTRAVLMVGQVALSIALLIGAGLMLRTMYALRHVPLGFRTDHLVLTSLTIPADVYTDRNLGTSVWQPLLDEIRRIPGVRSAALSTALPIQHPVELITPIDPPNGVQGDDAPTTVRAATPNLMDVLGIPMRSGRFFTEQDTASGPPVMVVNQIFVNRYLGGGNAVGKSSASAMYHARPPLWV